MPFTYALYPNPLKENYKAQAQNIETYALDDVVNQMTREGSILKPTECYAVLNAFFDQLAANLQKGIGFQSDYLRLMPGIKGAFEAKEDSFDPKKHKTVANVSAGKALKKAANKMETKKIDATPPKAAHIKQVQSLASQVQPPEIATGRPIEIKGELLKVDLEQPDEGVFLIHTTTQQTIPLTSIYRNYPSIIQCIVPDALPAGHYYLEIRNRPFRTKTLRTARFPQHLLVT